MTENLRKWQIAVLLAIASLEGDATVGDIEKITKLSLQSIRNTLSELTKLGLIASRRGKTEEMRSIIFGSFGKNVGQKEARYSLTADFGKILEDHQEILELSKKVFQADSEKKLKEVLKKIRSVAYNEEVFEQREILEKLKEELRGKNKETSITISGLKLEVLTDDVLDFIEKIEKKKKLKRGENEE